MKIAYGACAELAEKPLQVIEIIERKSLRRSGEGVAKMLISFAEVAEVFPYTTYRPAAPGAGRLRTCSSRTFLAVP